MTDIHGAQKIAEKLRVSVENTQVITDTQEPISFTISLGVESVHKDDIEIEDVLKRADKALYIAKESGRNRVVVASDYEI
jgi:diguanylate cyclase (GGDEF)-like protein